MRGAPGQHLLDKYQERLEVAQHRHGVDTVGIRCTPGHDGLAGNEKSDTEAKKATHGDSSLACQFPKCRGPVLVSRSAKQQSHLKRLGDKATSLFTKSLRCQRLRSIDPFMPLHRFRKITQDLPNEQASLLIQLRTGHIPLQKYLHKIRKVSLPRCPACLIQDETVHHYLLTCPAYRPQRGQLERTMRRAARSISMLLVNPKVFPHLFQYVNATQCFQHEPKHSK